MSQDKKSKAAQDHILDCRLCGNRCGVNRGKEVGICGTATLAEVSSWGAHMGEEPPISGERGCGNIFFTGCNFACVFCQNWQISQEKTLPSQSLDAGELADLFLKVQDTGVHTLGLVSPTAHIPVIVPALEAARGRGLSLPVVFNTNAYETVEALRLLEGLVDIYLPDLKYGTNSSARIYSGITDYVDISRMAVEEMVRQVGHLQVNDQGLATRGVLFRHLILPGDRADTTEVLHWLARRFGPELSLSLMAQYNPMYQVNRDFFPEINRPISEDEYQFAISFALGLKLTRLYIQELSSKDLGIPDFSSSKPFSW